jgi:hypothetical protein
LNRDKFSTLAAYKASDLRIIVNNELGRNLKGLSFKNSDCLNSDKFSTFAAYKASNLRIIVNNELGKI